MIKEVKSWIKDHFGGSMTVKDEIAEMNKSFGYEGVKATEAPHSQAPSTKAPGTPVPTTKAPTTKAPTTKAPTTEIPDEKDKEIAELRAKLAEKESVKKPATKAPTTPIPDEDFLKDLDLDEVTRDPKQLNKVLNQVHRKAVTQTLSTVPDIVKSSLEVIQGLQTGVQQFYTDNEDLKAFPNVVATVFDEVVQKDPKKTFADVMKDVAPEVRKRLKLAEPKKEEKKKEDKKDPPPPPPNSKRGSSGRVDNNQQTDPLADELAAMRKTLGR